MNSLFGTHCTRCNTETAVQIMSMYNTDWICIDCKDEEKTRPDYNQAVAKDIMELADRVDDPGLAASLRKQANSLLEKTA
jgi:hypothetical protein